ncbi:leukotoxin LktA family filamentous adhesin [Variovorax saccharolyticus]|uniref:leukotoxin LktA family filamentous adhesin n=1 Tax=Variovorax saccharolyticus TaxID=3053516 RepID=UPI002A428E9B|nr:leukotoxin LktA family filamentous adhesin [Variovorax sp. J31P216]
MHSHSSMNRVYRVVWNEALNAWVAVAETARGRGKGGRRRRPATSVLAFFAGAALSMGALAGPLDTITLDGRTQTTLGLPSANVVNITTSTIRGTNAFNSFSTFGVQAGVTANLYLPAGTANLINIVRDARTDIYGVVNGIQGGAIGGNVWFANPYGVVVGSTGVVNVGSLTIATPTSAFVRDFFTSNGNPDATSVTQLLNGTAPTNGDAVINIQGRINAINGVTLSAGAIKVGGSIYSGAAFQGSAPDFTDVVNANGISYATAMVNADGRIRIVAEQAQGGTASIQLDGAKISAANIDLAATATRTDSSLAVSSGVEKAESIASIGIQSSQLHARDALTANARADVTTGTYTLPVAVTVQRASADASVTVGGSSAISTGGDTALAASATVTTVATPTSALANLAGDAAVAVSDVSSNARVRVTGTADLQAGGKLGLAATNTVNTTSVADASAAGSNAAGASVAVSKISTNTVAAVDGDAHVSAGSLDVAATSSHAVTASARSAAHGASQDSTGQSQGSQVLTQYKDNASTADNADGEGIKVAGAVVVSDLKATTQAYLASTQAATVTGAAAVRTQSVSTVDAKADGSATSGSTGVAAAVAINLGTIANEAYVAQDLSAGSLAVSATLPATPAATNSFTTSAVSGAGASSVGVAGSLSVNAIDSATTASLRTGSHVTLTGTARDVALRAVDATASHASATPADGITTGGDKVGIGASVAVNVVATRTRAALEDGARLEGARDLAVTAVSTHDVKTEAEAGSEGGVSITPSVAVSVVNRTTQANLGSAASALALSGDLALEATQTSTTETTAKGSAVGGKAAIGAAVAVALVDDTVRADTARAIVADGSAGAGKGQVSFKAAGASSSVVSATASASGGHDSSDAGTTDSSTGKPKEDASVDDKIGKQLALGKKKQTANGVGDTQQKTTTADGVDAQKNGEGSASTSEGKVAVAAAVGVNLQNSTARAQVPTNVNAAGRLTVAASNNTDAKVSTDGNAVGEEGSSSKVGIGAAVSVNKVASVNEALVSGQLRSQGLTVTAGMTEVAGDTTHSIDTSASAGAGGSSVGVAGALALNLIDTSSRAAILSGAQVDAGSGSVALDAEDNTRISAKAAPIDKGATGGKVGIGASVAVNITGNRTIAEVEDAASLATAGSVTLGARSAHEATTSAEAGASGGIAITPALALAMLDNTTTARIGSGAAISGANGVTVSATQSNTTTTTSKGSAEGEKAAIGAAVAIALVNDVTNATTERDIVAATGDVAFTASSSSRHTTSASASSTGGKSDDEAGKTDTNGKKQEDATVDDKTDGQLAYGKQQQTKNGVGSSSQQSASSNAAGSKQSASSSEGKVSVAAAVAVNVIDAQAIASIGDGRTVGTTGALSLAASGQTDASAASDGTAVGKTAKVGIGAGVSVNQVDSATTARVGQDAVVSARGLSIGAAMTDVAGDKQNDVSATAQSGAGGSKVGIAASLALNIANTSSVAQVGDRARIDALGGNVALSAQDATKATAQATPTTSGGASGGSVGVGASVAINIAGVGTTARVGTDASVVNAQDLKLSATSQLDSEATATAGANGGKLAFDAAVAVSTLNQTTRAEIASGARITTGGDVMLHASSSGTHTATAKGEAKSGSAAVGAAVAVITSDSTTQATLDRDLDAGGQLEVAASAERAYTSDATASAGGSQSDKTYSDNKSQADSSQGSQTLNKSQSSQSNQGTQGGGKVAIAAAVGVNDIADDVQAAVTGGRTISSGGATSVKATNASNFSARGAGDAVDPKTKVGVAVGVGISLSDNTTTASLADGTHLTGADGLTVSAESSQNTSPDFARKLAAEGVAGAGGSKVGVAGAFAVVVSNAQTLASIGANARIENAGAISVDAVNTSMLGAKAWAGAVGGNVGIGASVATVVSNNAYRATIGSGAQVQGDSLALNAENRKVSIPGVSLQVSDVDDVKNLPDRLTSGPLIGGTNYYAEAVSGAAGDSVAVSGAVALNVFSDTTETAIGSNARVTTSGQVSLASSNDASATSLAAGAAVAGKVGVGLSSASVSSDNTTRAHIDAGASVTGTGGISLDAQNVQDVTLVGFSGAVGGNVGVAGVANVLVAKNLAEASVADSTATRLATGGDLHLGSGNQLSLLDIASGVAVGGSVGVGVAGAVHTVENDTRSTIGAGVQAHAGGTTGLAATASEDLQTYAIGAAAAGSVAVGGAAIVNVLDARTVASIGNNAQINKADTLSQQALALSASDRTSVFDVVVGAGGGGSVGGGAAADVGAMNKRTQATVGEGAWVETARNATVQADSQEDLRMTGIGFGVGGSAGLAGSVAAYVLTTDTEARIDDGATVRAGGSALVAADGRTAVDLIAGSAAGGGSTALGAAAGVVVLDKTTLGRIGKNAAVQALGNGAAIQAATGHYDIAYGAGITGEGRVSKSGLAPTDAQGNDIAGRDAFLALTQERQANRQTQALNGLAVSATNSDSVKAFAVTGAAAGAAAISLGANVTTVKTSTQAEIADNAQINQTGGTPNAAQSVRVAAGNEQFHLGLAGAASGAGAVAVGAGADVFVANNNTAARIGAGAQVKAARDVQVLAEGKTQVLDMGIGLSAAGTVAVAGSVAVVSIDDQTQAVVAGGTTRIDAGGNARIAARDDTTVDMVAGAAAAGFGAAGVGAAVSVSSIDKTTQAAIGDGATVNALGNASTGMTAYSGDSDSATVSDARGVQVQATSSEDLFTVAASGAAGLYAGISGAISVESVRSDTTAAIGANARINQSNTGANAAQDVNVTARNTLHSQVITGSVALGAGALAGGVDVGNVSNRTAASIGAGAQVQAARDIQVNGLGREQFDTTVVSGAGGLVGLAGGVAVYAVGDAQSQDAKDQLSHGGSARNVNQEADAQASDDTVGRMLATSDNTHARDAGTKAQAARSSVSITASLSTALPSGNSAQVGNGADLRAGRDIGVNARGSLDFSMTTGAVAVGALGLGAGVGIASFHMNDQALVGDNVSVRSGGDFRVRASLAESAAAQGFAGTGGIVALNAAYASLSDGSLTRAAIGSNVAIHQADEVIVNASDVRKLDASAWGASIGAVAGGASVATSNIGGATSATIGSGAAIGSGTGDAVRALSVTASGDVFAQSQSIAAAAGLGLALSGSVATAKATPDVDASIDGGTVKLTQDATVSATGKTRAQADAEGINVGLGAAAGASVANAQAVSRVNAGLGAGTSLSGRNLTVSATQQLAGSGGDVRANADGAAGALFAGLAATDATATHDSRVVTSVGNGSTLTFTGNAVVSADNDTSQSATVSGMAGGIVAAGSNAASATSNTVTQALVGDGVQIGAPIATPALLMTSLLVSADGNDRNIANAESGSGGLVSGAAATATTSSTSNTLATTGSGDNAHSLSASTLTLQATHRTDYNATVSSVNASVVGASGAQAVNGVDSTVAATVGADGRVGGNDITLLARNTSSKDWIGSANGDTAAFNIDSGSGGLVDLPAASSATDIRHVTTAGIGDRAVVHGLMPAAGRAIVQIDAQNDIVARDKAKLDSGGAISIARAASRISVLQSDATVSVGNDAVLTSDNGNISAGARANVALDARASANVYGLAGAPSGYADIRYTGSNRALVGTNALVHADDGAILLSGGQGTDGSVTRIDANATVNLWNKTAIPISITPEPTVVIANNAQVTLAAGSKVEAAEDISLFADKGIVTANAKGIGKDLYREALAAAASGISNLFGGGDVSFDVTGGSAFVGGVATVHVDGIAMTGINRRASLTFEIELIDANGNPVSTPVYVPIYQTDSLGNQVLQNGQPVQIGTKVLWRMKSTASKGVTYSVELGKGIGADILERIQRLRDLMAQYAGDTVATGAYQSEINFLMYKLVDLGLAKGAEDGSGKILVDASGQPIINPGQWSNPSPRELALTQIRQYQTQLISETGKATGSGQLIQDTTTTALASISQIGTSGGTIATSASTLATTNADIDARLRTLTNFSATNATYVATAALISDNTTQLTTISSQRTLNATDLATVTSRNNAIDTLIDEIGTRRTTMQSLTVGSTQYSTLQAEIDTRQASIKTYAGDIRTLLATIDGRNDLIDTASAKIAANNTTISSNQAAMATAFKGSAAGQDGIVTAINTSRTSTAAANARTSIATAASTIGTEAGKFDGSTGYLQTVGTGYTALDTAIGNKTSAATSLAQANSDLPNQSATRANGPIADFITVDDITVKLGNLRVTGDKLEGGGSLNSPGDASINITNNTPNFLKLGNLTVNSDEGGTLRFNGVLVNSTADIDRLNAGGSGASGLSVLTRDSSAAPKPSINITSSYDPNAAGTVVLAPAPNIELAGDISNLRGSVTVHSAAGSILSNGAIRAGSVDIKAQNGDFVQSYVDNFFHVGGDAGSIQDGLTTTGGGIIANGSVFLSARYLNINSLVQSGIENWRIDLPVSPVLTGTASFFGIAQSSLDAASTAYANADAATKASLRYVSFTVAAGQVRYDASLGRLEVDMNFAKADRNTAGWATRTSATGGLYQLVSDYGNIGARYDVVNNRFELDGTQVSGGYIQAYGQIINTSATSGTLRALDGYGQIAVNNPTGLAVVINKLDTGKDSTGTGRGIAGIIEITDIQSADVNTPAITTVYKRENGVITRNSVVDSTASTGRATTYAPQAGLRYAWTTGADNSLLTYWQFKGAQYFGSSDLRSAPTGTVESTSGPYLLDSYRLDNGTYLYKDTSVAQGYTSSSNTVSNGSPLWVKTGEWSSCNWWTLCIAGDYHMTFTETTPTKTITTKTLKADNPIRIEFSGYDTGTVAVNSAADVLLKGEIRNSAGNTTINAGSGVTAAAGVSTADRSIVQLNDTALVSGKNVTLNATGDVGGAINGNPARAVEVAVNGGQLDAAAAVGNVNVKQTVGDLRVGTVTAGGSVLDGNGRVTLAADGSIVAASAASLIQAQRVDLSSQGGGIGSIADPLKVNVGYSNDISKRGLYGLRASAQGDIGIESRTWSGNTGGDLLVDTVVSNGGDVLLRTPGRIVDNNPIESVDTRTWNELVAFWNAAGLREGTAQNDANQAQAIKSYNLGQTQQYKLYWHIRSAQADPSVYDPNFSYTATAAEKQSLGNDAVAIDKFEKARTTQYRALDATMGGLGNSYDSSFQYVASKTETDAILNKASWTDRELGISISAGLLKDVTSTNPVVKNANVSGRTVTLQAGTAIGETQAAVVVPTNIAPENLTDAMKVALASAERSDVVVTDSTITVLRRAPVNFSVVDALNVAVTATPVAGTDNGAAYLASMGNAPLGSIATTGDTRIKVRGTITNANGSAPAVQTGNLVLEAASGGIGFVPGDLTTPGTSQPLRLNLRDGATLTARAADNVEINAQGDLNVDTVFSRKTVKLNAAGAITDAVGTDELNVLGEQVELTAQGGAIGAAGTGALGVGVTGTTGRITAIAAGDLFLNGTAGRNFFLGDLSAGGALGLAGLIDTLLDGQLTAAGNVSVSAGNLLSFSANTSLHASGGNVQLQAYELRMADGSSLVADTGTVRIDTTADAAITGISTGNGTANAVRISAGGDIRDAGDTRLDVVADTAPAAGVTLQAGGSIGPGNALEMRLLHLDADAGGSADLAVQGGVQVGHIAAIDSVHLAASGDITTTQVGSTLGGVSLTSSGGNVNAGGTNARGDVILGAATGSVIAAQTNAGGRIDATAAQGLSMNQATAGSHVVLTAGGNVQMGDVTSTGGSVGATSATGSVQTTNVTSHTDVALHGAQGVTAGTTTAGGDVTMTADAGNVNAGRTTAGGDIGMTAAAGSVTAGTSQAGGAFTASAARDMHLDSVTAHGDIALTAGGALQANTLASSAGRIGATSGGDMTLGTVTALGDIALDAGRNLTADQLTSVQGSVAAMSRTGDVRVQRFSALLDGTLSAPQGQLAVGSVTAGRDFTLVSSGDVSLGSGSSPGTFTLTSTRGNVTTGTLSANGVALNAAGTVKAGLLNIASFFSLAGDRIAATVHGGANPVRGNVTGYGGTVASDVVLALAGQGGFLIDKFYTHTAKVSVGKGMYSVNDLRVLDRATIEHPDTQIVIDQHDRSIHAGADLQLYSAGAPMQLSFFDNHVFTDAFVVYRDANHDQIASMGLNRSAAEYSEISLAVATQSNRSPDDPGTPGRGDAAQASPVTYAGAPVSLTGQCGLVPECKP